MRRHLYLGIFQALTQTLFYQLPLLERFLAAAPAVSGLAEVSPIQTREVNIADVVCSYDDKTKKSRRLAGAVLFWDDSIFTIDVFSRGTRLEGFPYPVLRCFAYSRQACGGGFGLTNRQAS